jgi:hypothetical protein
MIPTYVHLLISALFPIIGREAVEAQQIQDRGG